MDDSALLSLFDREQRHDVIFPDARREETDGIVRQVSIITPARGGAVIYGRYGDLALESLIRKQVAFFAGFSDEFEWKLYDHDTPPELRTLLEQNGFVPEEPETVVVLDMHDPPAWISRPMLHDVRQLTRPEQLSDVRAVEEAVWGEDFSGLIAALGQELSTDSSDLGIYAAYVDSIPASVAWIRFHRRSLFASLWGGSTIESHRGLGLYTALLAVRAREALRRDVRFLTVDASDMSRPILVRHGFRVLTHAQAYIWRRGASGTAPALPADSPS